MIKMMNKKVVELTVAEVKGMTVAELRNVAKDMGLKGVSKLRKAELVEVILSNLSVNREIREKIEKVEDGLKMKSFGQAVKEMEDKYFEELNARLEDSCIGDFTMINGVKTADVKEGFRNFAQLLRDKKISKEDKAVLVQACEELAIRARRYNKITEKAIMEAAAKLKQHAEFRVEIDSFTDKKADDDMLRALLEMNVNIEHKPESELYRAVEENSVIKTIADSVSSIGHLKVVEDYITLSLGQSLRNVNAMVNGKRDEKESSRRKELLEKVLDSLLFGKTSECKSKLTIALKFHKNGLVSIFKDGIHTLDEGEYYRVYKYLGVTPSGLRSGSLILGCVAKCEMKNGEYIYTENDNRLELIDKAGSGAFKQNFMENNKFKDAASKKALFKGMTRIMQCAPGSEKIATLDTYVILDNIAKGTKFTTNNGQVISADDSKDGNTKGAVECIIEHIEQTEPVGVRRSKLIKDARALVGTCDQTRVASSMKASTTWCTRKDLIILLEEIAFRNNNILTIVVNGKRFDTTYKKDEHGKKVVDKNAYQQVIEAGLKDDLYAKIQLIGDYNAFKLVKFNTVVDLVRLKKAHTSESATNMVVLMAMLFADLEGTVKYLKEKGAKEILKTFEKFGLKLELSNGHVLYKGFDIDSVRKLNNDSQDIQYLFKIAPAFTMAAFPSITKSLIINDIKAIQRKVNELKFDFNSKYTVVQSDDAVLFGQQILKEDEIFCPEFESVKRVSAVRHPISSIFAVTTFKVVTLTEILERIYNLNCSNKTKTYLANFYSNVKGYAVLPAYKFLMEKHDGMDWDIDAMQIITEEEAVEILGKLPNIGSEIPDSENWQREMNLMSERQIVDGNYDRPAEIDSKPVKKEEEYSPEAMAFGANINTKTVYDYSFNSCLRLVKEFFTSPIANVGEIATAFYNNMLLYIVMANKSKDAYTIKIQEAIALEFKRQFNCKQLRSYVPLVDLQQAIKESKEKGSFKYKMTKILSQEVIWRFSDSNGSVSDVRDFLLDCGFFNRYLAETSIDAAKNNYFISNIYKFQKIVKALGSDKNMKIELKEYHRSEEKPEYSNNLYVSNEELDKLFESILDEMGLSVVLKERLGNNVSVNTFKFPLLYASTRYNYDFENVVEFKKFTDYEVERNLDITDSLGIGVIDPLAEVKLYLLDIANKSLVTLAKVLELEALSDRSKSIRSSLSVNTNLPIYKRMNFVFNSVTNAYSAMTKALKETDDFDQIASSTFRKECLIKGLRNFVRIATSSFSNEIVIKSIGENKIVDSKVAIGLAVAAKISSISMDKKANPALFKIFNEELFAFLKTQSEDLECKDLDNLGRIAEPISTLLTVDNKVLSTKKLEDYLYESIEIKNGIGSIKGEDEIFIETKDVKANIKGSIMHDETLGYYIEGEREFIEDDASVGTLFATDYKEDLDATLISQYSNFRILTKKEKGVFNKLVAVDSEGSRLKDIASLSLNKETVNLFNDFFDAGILNGENMSATKVEEELDGKIVNKEVIFINGAATSEIINQLKESEEEIDFNFGVPVDADAVEENENMDFCSNEAAIDEINNNANEAFNFSVPM